MGYITTSGGTLLFVSAGVLIGATILLLNHYKKKNFHPVRITRHDVGVSTPTNFLVYNYFPKHSIAIDIIETNVDENSDKPTLTTTRLLSVVKPLSTAGLTKDQVWRYLKRGNTIRIYLLYPSGERKLYSDYFINTKEDERIKGLHVGMITTRFIGTSTDGLRMSTTSGNAVGGNAFLRIHNLTYIPIRLASNKAVSGVENADIQIEGHSTTRYLGYLHQGVTLGSYFIDLDELYPTYQLLEPYSDLYYGVVSDLRQPLKGCFQLEYTDDCEYGQTLWPFQEGVL